MVEGIQPVLDELSHIAGTVETARATADQATITELRHEIAQLRALVAHLRGSQAPIPRELKIVAARALVDNG